MATSPRVYGIRACARSACACSYIGIELGCADRRVLPTSVAARALENGQPQKSTCRAARSRKAPCSSTRFLSWRPTIMVSGRALWDGPLYHVVSQAHRPSSGTERPRQIFRASTSEISVCLGTASTAPVVGLVHRECAFALQVTPV